MLKENVRKYLQNTWLGSLNKSRKEHRFRKQWRKRNSHNDTFPVNRFDQERVKIGKYTYGELNVVDFGTEHMVSIGNYVSIAQQVTFLLDAEHHVDRISTFPFRVKMLKEQRTEAFGKGDIIVRDDVWIGFGATILSGVEIGQGAIVASGAVVVSDVPPYAIVGGVPAKIIKYRFPEELIQELLQIDYSQLNEDMIRAHIDELYQELTDISQIKWMLRKF